VVVVTGHGDTALEQEALSLNAAGFIHKPIEREEIENVLSRV
jgi:FixJ family two-component response regulator